MVDALLTKATTLEQSDILELNWPTAEESGDRSDALEHESTTVRMSCSARYCEIAHT
jgi:hypothetical protein